VPVAQIKSLLNGVLVLFVHLKRLLLHHLHQVAFRRLRLRQEAHVVGVAPVHFALRVEHVVVEVTSYTEATFLVLLAVVINLLLEVLNRAFFRRAREVVAQHCQMVLDLLLVLNAAGGVYIRTYLDLLL
jgi:hypothetical protein